MTNEHENMKKFEYGCKCPSCASIFRRDEAGSVQTSRAQWDSAGGSPAEYKDVCPICGRDCDDDMMGWYDNDTHDFYENDIFNKLCAAVFKINPHGKWGWMRVAFWLGNDNADWSWCQAVWHMILADTAFFELSKDARERVELHKKLIGELCND